MPFLWRWSGKKKLSNFIGSIRRHCVLVHTFAKCSRTSLHCKTWHTKKKKRDNKTERWQNKHILALDVHFMRRADSESVYCQKEKQKQTQTQNRNKNKEKNKQKTCQDENNAWVPSQVIRRTGWRQCISESPHCKLKWLFTRTVPGGSCHFQA